MTSKECLKHLMEEMTLSQAKAQIIMGMPSKDEMEINKLCYQQVLKDLEILEIFKKHLIKVDVHNGKIFSIDIHSFANEEIEDYLKIKEWLDK